jgi:UDP-glucuronate 4-epimerase
MKILITGTAGFIGSSLACRLLERGDQVVGIDNFDPFYSETIKRSNLAGPLNDDRFELVELDLRDPRALSAWWEQTDRSVDAVVHLAARVGVRPSIADPVGYHESNVGATRHLFETIFSDQCQRSPKLIFASSSSVYGNVAKIPFAEDDPLGEPISPYAQTKLECEKLCLDLHRSKGVDTFCLRFFTVYGPRQRPDLAIHRFTANILSGQPIEMFGNGLSSRDYTYIDDIVDGLVAAIDRCAGFEIINLGSENPISLTNMIAVVEQACGRRAAIIEKPPQQGDLQRTFADLTKAKRLLDYRPKTDFADGIQKFVDWYRR